MPNNFTDWHHNHKRFAKKYLEKNHTLEELPEAIFEWIKQARPVTENKKRDFRSCPFWIPIYEDTHDYQMIMGGRQIYKSTACTDFIAHAATTNPGIQICYVTYDRESLSGFSKQRLKIGTFLVNPKLAKYLRNPGNVGEISLKNNSTIYLVTDNYQYRHLEGKSPELCVIDEAQYQDLEYFGKVDQTMMATKGKLKIFGIGGEAGGPYEKLWKMTNQMEWEYDDPDWRDKLQFDEKGLVIGDYMKDVLRGQWVPQSDSEWGNGYHLPQTIFPMHALTEKDAVEKYKMHPRFSIEFQKKNSTYQHFASNVMGTFYNSPHRPITKQMIENCTIPYRYLTLLNEDEIIELKKLFGKDITIAMGVDFGSGSSSVTAIAILILWNNTGRVQLAFIEERPQENQMMQAEYITYLFKKTGCDIGIGDLGYGANQMKIIQDGGYSMNNGEPFKGVTDENFLGCRSISDPTKPLQIYNESVDEHGEKVAQVKIDKTFSIDWLVTCMDSFVHHPLYPEDERKKRAKLIIPYGKDYEVDFLLNDFTKITRKDLQMLEKSVFDPRQRPQREYNHPPDSVMALIYGLIGFKVKENSKWNWISA